MKEVISYGRFQCPELAPHKNRGMEITYVEKGMLEWMVEGVPEKVETGSVFFTLPWQVHGSLNPKEPENTMWHILFHLEDDAPEPCPSFRFPKRFGFGREEMKILSRTFAASNQHSFLATPAIRELIPALIAELQSTHELREAHATTLLRAVLVELKRIVAGEVVSAERRTLSEQRVQKLVNGLSSSCDQQWTLPQMVSYCGIQRTQLGRIFQKLTGCTPMEYLSRLRMERAKTLLRETDISITEIAFACGFSSSQYFANTFKGATRMTPTAYRVHCAEMSVDELQKWADVDFRSEQEEHQRVQSFTTE